MDQRGQRSDLSFSAGEGLGQGVDDELIGELEERIRHGRGPIGIARCCDELSNAGRKSKVESQVNSRRVHCRRRALAPGLFPSGLKDCWCFPGAAS